MIAAERSMRPAVNICMVPHLPHLGKHFEHDYFQECCCRSVSENKASSYELSTQAPKQHHLLVILTVFIVQLQELTYREYFNSS